ncbi:hypothetical protein NKI86_32160, partial [Mesorhizobium sp. M0320]|uniref:hypothetical protein n=1 Tax=Mesorhizobium sp. M0320 TaxID=2956936 RepID=UPI00333BFFAF
MALEECLEQEKRLLASSTLPTDPPAPTGGEDGDAADRLSQRHDSTRTLRQRNTIQHPHQGHPKMAKNFRPLHDRVGVRRVDS